MGQESRPHFDTIFRNKCHLCGARATEPEIFDSAANCPVWMDSDRPGRSAQIEPENASANSVLKERECVISLLDNHVSCELSQFRIRGSESLDQFLARIWIGGFA
jgi:hypothetical protein